MSPEVPGRDSLVTAHFVAWIRSRRMPDRRRLRPPRAREDPPSYRRPRGALTLQRFGSALNLTPHLHTLGLDGVFIGPSHSPGDFAALPPPDRGCGGPSTGSNSTRAALSLCRSPSARPGSSRSAVRRAARLSTQDAVARRDNACLDGAAGAARTAGAADPAAAGASGSLPRGARAVFERTGPRGAGWACGVGGGAVFW